MNEAISTTAAPAAIGPYSQALKNGRFLYISGQLPIDPATGCITESDIKAQTTQSIRNQLAILKEAGGDLENVVKTTVFLSNMDDFSAMNEVYQAFFKAPYPARSAVEVAKLPKGALVEIEAFAIL